VDELKAVPNNLKSAFAADTKNINGGYPILRWQVGTHDSSYFKFTVNAEKETIYSKASINVTADGVNKTSAPVDITEIKLEPGAGVDFYVNITNVPDTVKVNSITLE
ncbi:MAG: hypothetical protein PUD92_04120, partial [Clostridiales bacterium]|nr:hypothetical protein [Clostridiales bacterium]